MNQYFNFVVKVVINIDYVHFIIFKTPNKCQPCNNNSFFFFLKLNYYFVLKILIYLYAFKNIAITYFFSVAFILTNWLINLNIYFISLRCWQLAPPEEFNLYNILYSKSNEAYYTASLKFWLHVKKGLLKCKLSNHKDGNFYIVYCPSRNSILQKI